LCAYAAAKNTHSLFSANLTYSLRSCVPSRVKNRSFAVWPLCTPALRLWTGITIAYKFVATIAEQTSAMLADEVKTCAALSRRAYEKAASH